MKALFVLTALFISTVASAASSEMYLMILESPEVKRYTNGSSIDKIEETASSRCIGCYGFQITQVTPAGEQMLHIHTRGEAPGKYSIRVSVSK
jgi:hypothetical protein